MRQARISIVNTHCPGLIEDDCVILERAKERIHCVARDRPDLVLLPEVFANHRYAHVQDPSTARLVAQQVAETVPGPLSEELAELAEAYHMYIAFGLLRRDGPRYYNSLVLLDRQGHHVWTYDKLTPLDAEMTECGISPGGMPSALDCDFGRIGAAICFDINFPELAEIYAHQEVELLLFASAFPAGRLLDAWSLRYGFAIASSTHYHNNRVLDCTGTTVARTSDLLPYATAVLNLNRRVVHMDRNLAKLDLLRTRYAGSVIVEDMRDEALCVITSLEQGLEVADLIKEFDIMLRPAYFDYSRSVREQHGGMTASASGMQP